MNKAVFHRDWARPIRAFYILPCNRNPQKMSTSDDAWMERDLVGYGPDRPAFQFPKNAKIAINCEISKLFSMGLAYSTDFVHAVVLNHEEGGERSVEDGDEHVRPAHSPHSHELTRRLGTKAETTGHEVSSQII